MSANHWIADPALRWQKHILKAELDLKLLHRRQLATGGAHLDFEVFAAAGCAVDKSAARAGFRSHGAEAIAGDNRCAF